MSVRHQKILKLSDIMRIILFTVYTHFVLSLFSQVHVYILFKVFYNIDKFFWAQ